MDCLREWSGVIHCEYCNGKDSNGANRFVFMNASEERERVVGVCMLGLNTQTVHRCMKRKTQTKRTSPPTSLLPT